MNNVHCFTSASFSYLDRVRVLGHSLRRHHPEWTFWVCISDRPPPDFYLDIQQEPFDRVVWIDELEIPNLRGWIFQHDVVELCTAVKGPMLELLLNSGADKVIYIDPDIALFNPLIHVLDALRCNDIVLTPHQLEPEVDRRAIVDNEIGSLKYGIFNLGFLGVSNSSEGRRFARWWRDRLVEFCFDDISRGLFTDQKWCNHVPVFFSGTHILREPGYNVASWNLSNRPITIDKNGEIYVDESKLRFFHFTKINWIGEAMLERYSGGRSEIFEMMEYYRKELRKNAAIGIPQGWWYFGRYADGTEIPKFHRTVYSQNGDLQTSFPDPFLVGGANTEFEQAVVARRS